MDAISSLVIQHQDYVRFLARGIAQKLPAQVDFEELVAFGQVGLVEAATKFKVGQGASFATYAYYRVRGAIFDGLRKMAGLPPLVRHKVSRMNAADDIVRTTVASAGLDHDPEFLASQFSDTVTRLGAVFLLSQAAEKSALDTVDTRTPANDAEDQDLVRRLSQALETLPAEEMRIVRLYYFEQQSMAQCAAALGVDKSTVSRTHAKAIETLRRCLAT
ncbi:MAG: sigma-70 family RNA polymerase sigma factor [Tepidisphaeraceae bacterium]|jgi:RNA polymerase sigma factor for flagellar operon FliA